MSQAEFVYLDQEEVLAAANSRESGGLMLVICDDEQIDRIAGALRTAVENLGLAIAAPGLLARHIAKRARIAVQEIQTDVFSLAARRLFEGQEVKGVVAPTGCVSLPHLQETTRRLADSHGIPCANSTGSAQDLLCSVATDVGRARIKVGDNDRDCCAIPCKFPHPQHPSTPGSL